MANLNKLTPEIISEINDRLNEEERLRNEQNSKLKGHTTDEFIEFMNHGMEVIEKSPTKHLMFKGL